MEQDRKEELLLLNRKRGTNQGAVRSYNERLILQLVREHLTLTKAEATRATGLSPNAVSVIFRGLESAGLLLRCEPIRGRIGQPSTPLRINPDARHYVALKIGRRSMELAVVNFAGEIKSLEMKSQLFPTPKASLAFVEENIALVLEASNKSSETISGMAVAMPFELWNWTDDFGAPASEMDAWRDFDVATELAALVPWPVMVENDATAACQAELVFGSHTEKQDWIYFFVGTFIGGGLVLNGSIFRGRHGNAGGFGPMRVPEQDGGNRLVDHASLIVLERAIAQVGGEPFAIYDDAVDWSQWQPLVTEWIDRAAGNLAHAIVSALSVMDFEGVVLDGAMPENVKRDLVSAVRRKLEKEDLQGVRVPLIEEGQVGRRARTKGAAAAILSEQYSIDQNTVWRR